MGKQPQAAVCGFVVSYIYEIWCLLFGVSVVVYGRWTVVIVVDGELGVAVGCALVAGHDRRRY